MDKKDREKRTRPEEYFDLFTNFLSEWENRFTVCTEEWVREDMCWMKGRMQGYMLRFDRLPKYQFFIHGSVLHIYPKPIMLILCRFRWECYKGITTVRLWTLAASWRLIGNNFMFLIFFPGYFLAFYLGRSYYEKLNIPNIWSTVEILSPHLWIYSDFFFWNGSA